MQLFWSCHIFSLPMDFVPLDFCDSVAVTVTQSRQNSSFLSASRSWKRAFEKQTTLELMIFFDDDGKWSLEVEECFKATVKTREELQNLNKKNLRVSIIEFDNCEIDEGSETSFEEIEETIQFLLPCLGETEITLCKFPSNEATCNEITRLHAYLNVLGAFSSIEIIEIRSEYEEFLKNHLKSDELKSIRVADGYMTDELISALEDYTLTKDFESISCPGLTYERKTSTSPTIRLREAGSEYGEFLKNQLQLRGDLKCIELRGEVWAADVQQAIEEYALSHHFERIDCYGMTFYMFFFERLYEVHVKRGVTKRFEAKFFMTIENLRNFKREEQIVSEKKKIEWIRTDVRVSVEFCQAKFRISFEHVE